MPRPKTTTRIGGPIGRIERKTLNDRVYGELKDLIMTGAFKPGAELTLRTVAEALGTSFMPVRDAMRRLVTEHALEMRPSRTMAVPVLSWDEFHELYKVRTLLEGEAVALAAQKISQRQLEDIRGILEKLQNLKSKRADHFWTLNLKLHFSIYEIGASPLMLSIIKSLWLQIGPIMARVPVSRALQDSSDPHHLLVRALERRDPAAARAALDMDLTHASARILKDLAPKGVIAH